MAKERLRRPSAPPEPPKPDLDSWPNDDLEEQLAADIRAITGVERELSRLVGPENRAARWLRMLGRVLPDNARCAKSHRVDPPPNMRAERIQQCRQETLQHSRVHAEEAKATLEWYKENPEGRREQLPPTLKTRGEALADLGALLWRSSPEGRLATMTAGLERLCAVVEKVEGKGSPDAARLRERYDGCVRMADLMKRFVAGDRETKDRLRREMESLEAEEAQALEAMRRQGVPAGEGADVPVPGSTPASPFTGRWRLVSVTQKGMRPASGGRQDFIEFEGTGQGRFRLGDARGDIDGKACQREGKDAIDFSWEGTGGSGGRWGRGAAVLEGKELHGTLFVHKGGESAFMARRSLRRQGQDQKQAEAALDRDRYAVPSLGGRPILFEFA